ncbi:MAG: hypothetical protein KDG51_05680, partial [Calditrichaeota bacterium]|nr:hypothetical protein [Calditrichota bacterium]
MMLDVCSRWLAMFVRFAHDVCSLCSRCLPSAIFAHCRSRCLPSAVFTRFARDIGEFSCFYHEIAITFNRSTLHAPRFSRHIQHSRPLAHSDC